jgi:hypothetical protein
VKLRDAGEAVSVALKDTVVCESALKDHIKRLPPLVIARPSDCESMNLVEAFVVTNLNYEFLDIGCAASCPRTNAIGIRFQVVGLKKGYAINGVMEGVPEVMWGGLCRDGEKHTCPVSVRGSSHDLTPRDTAFYCRFLRNCQKAPP